MSSPSAANTGNRLTPLAIAMSRADGHRGVVVDDEHVGPRHHHLSRHGVAELDDALDELALLVLDHVVVGRGADDAEQLLLVDERSLLQALAGQQHVGEADESPADEPQRRERHQPVGRPGGEQRRPLGRQHGPRLGHRFGDDEEHDDVEHEADRDALGPEEAVGESVVRNAWPICRIVTVTSSGVMKRSGLLTRRSRARVAFESVESTRAWALTREMRFSDVSAMAKNASTTSMAHDRREHPELGAGHRSTSGEGLAAPRCGPGERRRRRRATHDPCS